ALLLLRLYRSLDALVGGSAESARVWLRSENFHLGGIPAERIRTIQGLVDVVAYLDGMQSNAPPRPLRRSALPRGGGAAPDLHPPPRGYGRGTGDPGGAPRPHQAARAGGLRGAALPALFALPLSSAAARLPLRHPARALDLLRLREALHRNGR